jgi:protein-tyrosine phosphatase
MNTKLFWIDGNWAGRVAISSRARGGDWLDDEVKTWRQSGVHIVVSLLMPEEARDLGLDEERKLAKANGIEFFSLPMEDRGVPARIADVEGVLSHLKERLDRGENVAIHCRQGIGRAAMVAAALLIESGSPVAAALGRVRKARGVEVPETAEQLRWLDSFASTLKKPSPALR